MARADVLLDQIRADLGEGLKKVGTNQSPFVRRLARAYYRRYFENDVARVVMSLYCCKN